MPVEQRDPRQTVKAIVLGLGAVAAAVGFLVLVLIITDRGGVEITLGDDRFEAGRIDEIAAEIDENGPIRYADLVGGRQNIILQHLGEDLDSGWYAFDLIRPGQPPECQLEWFEVRQVFIDPCDETEIPPTGFGQPTYPVEINDDDRIVVDFRAEPDPTN